MGLFAARPGAHKLPTLRLPVRIHSEFSLLETVTARIGTAGPRLKRLIGAAVNDSRVVGALLVVAMACLILVTAESVR